jgi:TRAP-type C4-dicarboxylate transport system substrate-binding protein
VDGLMLNTIMSLPFMGWPNQDETSVLYDHLLDQFPAMREEWGELTVVAMTMMAGSHMHFKDVAVTNPSDLDGVKVMGAETMTTEAVEAAGAIPVALSITEMGTALDNGTIDGVINHFAVLKVFGVLEKMSSHLVFGEGGINMTPVYIVMNKHVLENLDEDLQALLVNSGNSFRDKFFELDSAFQEATRQEAIDEGHTITELTSEQVEQWRADIAQPVHDAWIAAAEADGLPGQDIYDEVINQLR